MLRLRLRAAALHPDRPARPVPAAEGDQGPSWTRGPTASCRWPDHLPVYGDWCGCGSGDPRMGRRRICVNWAAVSTRVRLSRKTCWSGRESTPELLTALIRSRSDHHRARWFIRRARHDDPAVRTSARGLRRRAASSPGPSPAADRQSDLIAQIAGPLVKGGKPVPATTPTTSRAKSPPWRSRCTPP